mgnify:CR=1 FL=1
MSKKLLLIITVVSTLLSCSKEDDNTIVGKYKMIGIIYNIGAGEDIFRSENSNKTIEFHSNGTITSNGELCSMSIEANSTSSGTYSIEKLTINPDDCNDQPINTAPGTYPLNITFELNGNELILDYGCTESCGSKYLRQ